MQNKVVNIFISYAYADEKYRKELLEHLEKGVNKSLFKVWSDQNIPVGANIEEEIKNALERSDIVLLLVSADFMASERIHKVEMPIAVKRNRWGQVIVIPIIIRPVVWQELEVSRYAALPNGGIPVSTWDDREEAWKMVANPISRLVKNLSSGKLHLKKSQSIEVI